MEEKVETATLLGTIETKTKEATRKEIIKCHMRMNKICQKSLDIESRKAIIATRKHTHDKTFKNI